MRRTFLGLITVLCLGLAACDTNRIYQQVYDFDEATGWHLDTIPAFTFTIKDKAPKNLILNVRNSIAYEYQNVYLTWYLEDKSGKELASELVNIQLFDEKTGKPTGQGSSIYQHAVTVLENYSFPSGEVFTFKVAQYMRETELKEIASVGVRVESAGD